MTPDPAPSGSPSAASPRPSGSPSPPKPSAPTSAPAGFSSGSRDTVNVATAGLLTAAAAFGQWAQLAARYVEQITPALGGKSGTPAPNPVTVLTDSYVAYVRDVAELPRFALLRFYNELARLKGEAPPG